MTRRSPSDRCAGFTLMEVVIAAGIMVLVLAAVHTVFFGAIRLREHTIDAVEASQPKEEALQTIQRDLANLVGSTNGTFFGPLQSTTPTNALPGQIGPHFYTSGGELDGIAPWGNVEQIDYLLAAPTNGLGGPGQDLIRATTHNLLPINQIPAPDEKRTLLHGVRSLTFLYYDGTQWDSAWDTTQQTNLPLAIKVQIQMSPSGNKALAVNQPLELVVPIDLMLNTNVVTGLQ